MIKDKSIDLFPIFNMLIYKATSEFQVLRELISRTYVAKASEITINISFSWCDGLIIEVIDNGMGMSAEELSKFFIVPDQDGNKFDVDTSILLNCSVLEIWTGKKGERSSYGRVDSGYQKYDVVFVKDGFNKSIKDCHEMEGSRIKISGYDLDNLDMYNTKIYDNEAFEFIKNIYNYKRIEDYLIWNTLVGNMKKIFWGGYGIEGGNEEYITAHPKIIINDEINHRVVRLDTKSIGMNQMFSGENTYLESNNEEIYKRSSNMCHIFKKYHRREIIDGEVVSFYLYGYVAGEKYRLSNCYLGENEKLSDRFGIYLAKDFVVFKKQDNLMNDINKEHFKIVINSDSFKLSLNKTDITNKNNEKVKWILKEADKIINGEIIKEAYDRYFRIREEEVFEYRFKEKLGRK